MPLPVPANVTFDLFREGKIPTLDDPDVVAVLGHLSPAFHAGLEAGEGLVDPALRFTTLSATRASRV